MGFSQQVAKDDYIPESLFYLLGMKASNTAAQEFQRWLAVDVLPQIRKNGSYISASSADAELDNSMGTSGLDTYGQDLSPELKAIFCIDKRTVDVTNRIKKLENNMTIDYSQQEELRTFSSKESHWRAWGQGYTSLQRTEQKGFFKHMEGL